ncbi:MAG: hypothetical protein ABI472_15705 [Ginsengibacter sp.]
MKKPISIASCIVLLFSCTATGNLKDSGEMPECLAAKIKTMTADPHEGSPLYLSRYTYKQHTVYYMASPCCDRYNVVYDSACNILGYPDGGFTGKGDGKMKDFNKEGSEGKVIWKKEDTK